MTVRSPSSSSSSSSSLPLHFKYPSFPGSMEHSLISPFSASHKLNSFIHYYSTLTKFNRDDFIETCQECYLKLIDLLGRTFLLQLYLFVLFSSVQSKINVLTTKTTLFPKQTRLDIINPLTVNRPSTCKVFVAYFGRYPCKESWQNTKGYYVCSYN